MPSRENGLPRSVVAIAAVAALGVLMIVLLIAYGRVNVGRVPAGVSAAGVQLGGLSAAEAADLLADQLPATAGDIVLRDPVDGRTWTIPTSDLGLFLDAASVADAAVDVGSRGNAITRLVAPILLRLRGHDVLADPYFDEELARSTLVALAPEVDVAPSDAGFALVEGVAAMREPVYGRQLDVEGTLAALPALADAPDRSSIDLVVITTAPRVFDVGSVAQAYAQITSLPLALKYRGETIATVDADTLKDWTEVTTTTTPDGDVVPAIDVDETAIYAYLEPLGATLNRPPANARLRYVSYGDVDVIVPAEPGLILNVARSADSLIRGAYTEQRVAELDVDTVGPDVRDDQARLLSRKARMLAESYTSLGGAPEGRVRNLLAAAQALDGVSVGPGMTFSLSDALGEITAEAGFDMAQVTAGEPGRVAYLGGLEQVATTAFRAAVWAGLPIDMRVAPAYRTAWVEPPIGLDAAVGPAGVDLRLTNDTADPVFFHVAVDTDRQALSWTVYGISPERRVELIGPSVTDLTPSPVDARERRTDLLPEGRREQTAWARGGGDVVIERVVTEGGVVLRHDTFRSTYAATPDVVLVGTG